MAEIEIKFAKVDQFVGRRKRSFATFYQSGVLWLNVYTTRQIRNAITDFVSIGVDNKNPKNKNLYIVFEPKPSDVTAPVNIKSGADNCYISSTSPFKTLHADGYIKGYKEDRLHYDVIISEFQGKLMLVLTPTTI